MFITYLKHYFIVRIGKKSIKFIITKLKADY